MSLISEIGRKTFKNRCIMTVIYLILILMGTTMVVPFMITITGSTSNDFDYERFSPLPRYIWSRTDRFVKGLVPYFNTNRGWNTQFSAYAPEKPNYWNNWIMIGANQQGIDEFSAVYMNSRNPKIAADYAEFCHIYPLSDCTVYAPQINTINFLIRHYSDKYKTLHPDAKLSSRELQKQALLLLSEEWGLPLKSFYTVKYEVEMKYPMDFQSWFPPMKNAKYKSYLAFQEAAAAHFFLPGIEGKWKGWLKNHAYNGKYAFPVTKDAPKDLKDLWLSFKKEVAPASIVIPYAMRANWYRFLSSEQVMLLRNGKKIDINEYNKIAGTNYSKMEYTPFPVPASFPAELQNLWKKFCQERYPLRLVSVKVTPQLQTMFEKQVAKNLKSTKNAAKLLGLDIKNWSELKFTEYPVIEGGYKNQLDLWKNFVITLPVQYKTFHSSEQAYQTFLLKKYGNLAGVNKAYGWKLKHIEEAFPPFMEAYAYTFDKNENSMTFGPVADNYKIVIDFMVFNGNAIFVTLILILLTILFTLTINPLAAYALSRFNIRGRDKILIFMLATMAFPAMVSAIPAYLLMRDLGMLNTFAALVIPGAANGMAIFILKGFFDSLPMELFEAATIDGASEMQIFRVVAMPLVKPILAINCLNAFIAAYNGWGWALLICQDKDMWTIAVWLYQASMWWTDMPWVVSAGFVLASIPTCIVFISCQKIILRGIIIPSMK